MCNSCNSGCFGGMIFPSFVQNSCCNPCCANSSGSVGGASSNPSGNCTCTCTCAGAERTGIADRDRQNRLTEVGMRTGFS